MSFAALYIVVDTLRAVVTLYHPLPFQDSWDFVEDLVLYATGHYEFEHLWRQHNEHRIVFPRLLYFADNLYFSGRGVFLLVGTALLQVVHVVLLLLLVSRTGRLDRTGLWIAAAGTAICLFGGAQLDNFLWSFQIQFVLVYVAITLALLCLVFYAEGLRRGSRRSSRSVWLAASVVAAVVANYSMANGILVWPALFLLAIHLRLPIAALAAVGVVGAAAGGFYLWGYQTPAWHEASPTTVNSIPSILAYTGRFLGIPVQGLGPTPALLAGLAGMLAWALLALDALRRRRTMPPAAVAGVYLMAVLIATAGITAIGRAHMSGEEGLPSRYGTPALLFWAVTLLLGMFHTSGARTGRGTPFLAVVGLAALWLVYDQSRTFTTFVDRPRVQALAAMALLSDVRDEAAFAASHAVPAERFLLRARMLRDLRLAVFDEPLEELLIGPSIHPFIASDPLSHGGIHAISDVPTDPRGRLVTGWSFDASKGRPAERIVFVGTAGQILGFGAGGFPFPDAARVHPEIGDQAVGWKGYARAAAGEPIRALAFDLEKRWAQLLPGAATLPRSR